MEIQFILEIYVFRQNKKKNERAKETYRLSPSTPLTVFLIAEKLLSLCV